MLIRTLPLLITLCAVNLCAGDAKKVEVDGSDWPQFRGPKADGISPETGISKDWKVRPPKELWRIELSDNGFAGPSVAAGKMFIVDKDGDQDWVRAIDEMTGKDVWAFKYPEPYKPDQADWGRGRSTPVFGNGKVYTQGPSGMVHCLNVADGKKIWAKNIKADFGGKAGGWAYTAAPLIDGNKLIVCPGGSEASVAALNKDTGAEIWRGGGNDQAGYATPVLATIAGKRQYIVFNGHALTGVDTERGVLLWRFPWKTSYEVNAATPSVMGNDIFISSGYGTGCAVVSVQGGQPRELWRNKEVKAHFNSAIVSGGMIYSTGDPGVFVCLDPKTGTPAWSQPGFEKGGIIGVDGVIIAIVGNTGELVMAEINPKQYKELGRFSVLKGRSWTAPIIAGGKLYVRDMKTLVCLDLK